MAENQSFGDSYLQQITDYDVERRLAFVDLKPGDIARITAVKDAIIRPVDHHVAAFFDYLSKLDEAAALFRKRDLLDEAKRLKREHLIAMAQGDYGRSYVEQRIKIGIIYSEVHLDSRIFLGAFHHLMRSIGDQIVEQFKADARMAFEHFMSLKKVAFFDIGIINDVLISSGQHTIYLQQQAIRELSTPTLQVRDHLLILPIIGFIDSHRAKQLTENLLQAIRANRAKVVVIDITGVATVDSKVANHLIQTVAAARLMGATAIVTGLSAEVAQSLVTLGVDLDNLNTAGDLQGGLEEAERLLGYRIVALKDAPTHRAPG